MSILNVIVIFVLFTVCVTLVWGVTSMAHGGLYDRDHSEKLMVARIGVQAVAFAIIILALIFAYF